MNSFIDKLLIPGGVLRGALFARLMREGETEPVPIATDEYIGPFQIKGVIGQGGCGAVYLAERREQAIVQRVAIKIVKPNPALFARFRSEREHLAKLQHPNISRFIDAGETSNGSLWFAMDYIEGKTIADYCLSKNAHWREVIDLIISLAATLQAAHQQLIVHGDIKPNNVIVDVNGIPRLLDFGVSVHARESSPNKGAYLFTPGFASPEQLRGEPITTASDLYQVAMLCLHLLRLDQEFKFSHSLLRDISIAQQQNFRAIILKASSVTVTERYSGLNEFIQDINLWLQLKPANAKSWAWHFRLRLLLTRQIWLFTVSAVSIVLLSAYVVYHNITLQAQRDAAIKKANESEMATKFVTDVFRLAGNRNGESSAMSVEAMLDMAARDGLALIDEQDVSKSIAIRILAQAYFDQGQVEKAFHLVDQFLQMKRNQLNDEQLVRLMVFKAHTMIATSKFQEALEQLDSVADAALRLSKGDLNAIWLAHQNKRVYCLMMLGKLRESLDLAMNLLHAGDEYTSQSEEYASLFFSLSLINDRLVNGADAIYYAERAAQLSQSISGPVSLASLRYQNYVIGFRATYDNAEKALALCDEQLSIVAAKLGSESMQYAEALEQKANVLNAANRLIEAMPLLEQAIKIIRLRQPIQERSLARLLELHAGALTIAKRWSEAEAELFDALSIYRKFYAENSDRIQVPKYRLLLGQCRFAYQPLMFKSMQNLLDEYKAGQNSSGRSAMMAAQFAECLNQQGDVIHAKKMVHDELSLEQIEQAPKNFRDKLLVIRNAILSGQTRD